MCRAEVCVRACRVRDKLVSEWQTSQLRYEAERDNAGRLQLLLDAHKESADSLQVRTAPPPAAPATTILA